MKQLKQIFLMFGIIIPSILSAQTKGVENGHEWVDLGLSVKWATCNLGAQSPHNYGSYIAWGESSPKSRYSHNNSKNYGKRQSDISNTYLDSAKNIWGGKWRMPTFEEIKELMEICTWDWVNIGGHYGYKITGINGNSIFLPAAGGKSDDKLFDEGQLGYYQSSTPYDNNEAYTINFNSTEYGYSTDYKFAGMTIRPVLSE